MSIESKLAEDRALRDAARAIFRADVAFVKGDMAGRSIGQRLGDRLTEGTVDLAEDAAGFAAGHKIATAAGVTGLLAYLFRRPLSHLLDIFLPEETLSEEPQGSAGGFPEEDVNSTGEQT